MHKVKEKNKEEANLIKLINYRIKIIKHKTNLLFQKKLIKIPLLQAKFNIRIRNLFKILKKMMKIIRR